MFCCYLNIEEWLWLKIRDLVNVLLPKTWRQ
jgi:hypothetical protein